MACRLGPCAARFGDHAAVWSSHPAVQHPDGTEPSQLGGRRHGVTETEGGQRSAQAPRIRLRGLDEHVEILREAGLSVRRDGERADHDELDLVVPERSEEVAPVGGKGCRHGLPCRDRL